VAVGSISAAVAQPLGGLLHQTTSVSGLSTDSYQATFFGNQLAMITVHGDGDTDLDLYVYDEFGNCVVSDTRLGDQCAVTWVPRWTGRFTIRVVNRGFLPNFYTVLAS
jgi:hypothetical protein